MSLKGKVAVVTGGGSGVGRACCIQLARDGAAVGIWDWNEAGAKETADMIAKEGGRSLACMVDVSSRASVTAGTEQTRKEFGPVTVLVNNAGICAQVPFQQITDEIWDRMMSVNLKGAYICTQAVIPDMLAAQWGRIVNVTSSSTQIGAAAQAHYVASKGGMVGLTKALAREFARQGITVNAVPPNIADTPMLRNTTTKEQLDAYIQTTIMGRPSTAEDVAAAVSFLCSIAAKHVNGHSLSPNGGNYMN